MGILFQAAHVFFRVQLFQMRFEIHLFIEGDEFFHVAPAVVRVFNAHFYRRIGVDLRQLTREKSNFFFLDQVLFALRFVHLVDIFVQLFHRAVFFQQLDGGLVADAGHARDVVGRIARKTEVVDDLFRRHAHQVFDRFRRVRLEVADAFDRNVDADVVRC